MSNYKTKLNLGAGGWDTQKPGFLSVDLYADADLVHDVSKPFPYDNNSVEEIYASHIIEHLTRQEWQIALPEWYRILKTDGKLEIYCPDLEACLVGFLSQPTHRDWWIKTIYGSQTGPGQVHQNGFTFESLKNDLLTSNFKIVLAEKIDQEQLHFIAQK